VWSARRYRKAAQGGLSAVYDRLQVMNFPLIDADASCDWLGRRVNRGAPLRLNIRSGADKRLGAWSETLPIELRIAASHSRLPVPINTRPHPKPPVQRPELQHTGLSSYARLNRHGLRSLRPLVLLPPRRGPTELSDTRLRPVPSQRCPRASGHCRVATETRCQEGTNGH
jgi:hypothetical protein